MYTIEGVDTSYVQGNYQPGAESFVFVHASRANRGFLEVGSYYHEQVDNARSSRKVVGHFFFNGNRSATECANYFVDNLYDFRDGDWLWLDSEDEPATGTFAWGPNQSLEFINVCRDRTGVTPGMYLNRDLTNRFNWSTVVDAGSPLWLADYTGNSADPKWWPSWLCWQYTSNPIDRNKMQIGC